MNRGARAKQMYTDALKKHHKNMLQLQRIRSNRFLHGAPKLDSLLFNLLLVPCIFLEQNYS